MRSFNTHWSWFAVSLMLTGLIGCQTPQTGADSTSIQTVQYTDKITNIATLTQSANSQAIVYLKGRIGNKAPLLGGMVYELQDGTGSIWVLTKEAVPNSGDEIVVKGKVQYQSIRLNGKEQGSVYLEQQQQLQHTPAIRS